MRIVITIAAIAALSAAVPAAAKDFKINTIIPGEGAEGDCFSAFWRAGAKPVSGENDPPHIFEVENNQAYIKIDGKVYPLNLTSKNISAGKPVTYSGDQLQIVNQFVVTKVDKSKDGDTYYLKGTLKVTYHTITQALAVRGESFCYSGN